MWSRWGSAISDDSTLSISLNLEFPEGYSYNPNTGQISQSERIGAIPGGPTQEAGLPAYVTKMTLTITGDDMELVVLNVPLDTLTVSFAVTPGVRTFTLVVETSIPGLSFTDSITILLTPGGNPNLNFNLVINAPPTIDSLTASTTSTFKNTGITVTATATDPDGQSLSYSRDGGGGTIPGSDHR